MDAVACGGDFVATTAGCAGAELEGPKIADQQWK